MGVIAPIAGTHSRALALEPSRSTTALVGRVLMVAQPRGSPVCPSRVCAGHQDAQNVGKPPILASPLTVKLRRKKKSCNRKPHLSKFKHRPKSSVGTVLIANRPGMR